MNSEIAIDALFKGYVEIKENVFCSVSKCAVICRDENVRNMTFSSVRTVRIVIHRALLRMCSVVCRSVV